MSVELQVLDDPAPSCAAILLGPVLAGGHVVVTGGSTPGRAYEELARALRAAEHDISGATLWFSDERCVSPDDELSNYGLVERTLLGRLEAVGRPAVRRMDGDLGPEEAADRYEQELRDAGSPAFDAVLLGLGPDGHIASLFPDQKTLSESSRLVVGVAEAGHEPYVPRVSLTLPALTASQQIVVLVTGASKAQAVAAAFGPDAEPDRHVPASLLASSARELVVLLDPAAAAGL